MACKAYSPTGKPIIGSYEKVYGVALGEVTREKPNSPPEIEYDGETKIWWDSQQQVTENPNEVISEKLWVDEAHDIWKTSELEWDEV